MDLDNYRGKLSELRKKWADEQKTATLDTLNSEAKDISREFTGVIEDLAYLRVLDIKSVDGKLLEFRVEKDRDGCVVFKLTGEELDEEPQV